MSNAKEEQAVATKKQISKGLFELEKLLIKPMPFSPSISYLVACWVISSFMKEDLMEKGLLQVIGSSGTGKSKVLERWNFLFNTLLCIGGGTIAATRRLATKDPILFIDNIENRDLLAGRRDFLVDVSMSAYTHTVNKEAVNTERFLSLVMLSGIEPFPEKFPELINRTFPAKCESAFRQGVYVHSDYLKEIADKRDSILLAIEGLVNQKIRPALKEDRAFWMGKITAIAPDSLLKDHLCMMAIIMEALFVYIPVKEGIYISSPEQVFNHWLCN